VGARSDEVLLLRVLGLALLVAGVATKAFTGWAAGRRAGVCPAARLRTGGALVARGEFSNIIAGLVAASQANERSAGPRPEPRTGHGDSA
jgi:CPA2 family monovalent cation:H+ antiporter-2